MTGSEPWWPPRPTPPAAAPNVVVVLVDDLGYSDVSCFGSEIETPNVDALANGGLRYTNFHVNPMCSPTRASLLTGLNAHDAGIGHVVHSDPGYPGHAMELTQNCVTAAEVFRHNGYATLMVGKWHLCKDSDKSPGGNKNSWPVQRGFDEFYGFLGGFTNFHQPDRMLDGNSLVEVDEWPDDYYLTDDLTDRAISMIRQTKASNPARPFFMYFSHGAVHAPLQAKAADIERHRGAYDEGWDAIRQRRFERQIELGLISGDTVLPPRNSEADNDVKPWDELAQMEKELFARYMEIYAAMVQSVDDSLGQLRTALEEMGEWENTIVLFTSDNGASREGEVDGCSQYFEKLSPAPGGLALDHSRMDIMGGPQTLPHYPRGWAMAGNTPFRLYKTNTHNGGHQVPMILSWPRRFDGGGDYRRQYQHVTDVLPTLMDLIGLEPLEHHNGLALKPMAGSSFASTVADAAAPTRHTEQYYELGGHRGIMIDGWQAVTLHHPMTPFGDHEWELYNLLEDPTEANDLAAARPEKTAELAAAWEDAAHRYQVYPLDEGSFWRWTVRSPWVSSYTAEPVTVFRGTPNLENWRCGEIVHFRSFTVEVDLEYTAGDEGTLFAHGDQGGGYGLYVIDGALTYVHNGYGQMREVAAGALREGTRRIVADFTATDAGMWNLDLSVEGETVATAEDLPQLLAIAPFQGFDVGIDRMSPVSWRIWEQHRSFPFTGIVRSATWTPGEYAGAFAEGVVDVLREMGSAFE
jgi:arylsulfatase A-like enzyme